MDGDARCGRILLSVLLGGLSALALGLLLSHLLFRCRADAKPAAAPAVVPADVADVPSLDLRAGKVSEMRYFLIGLNPKVKAPKSGYRLLIVLPGGDGSAEFNPFVRRIWKNSLGKEYVLAQLVAPRWSEGQEEKLVWPTKKNPWPRMKFSTEEFVAAVIQDVGKRCKVDLARTFILGWSSGGPPAYASVLTPEFPVAGAFVAMSVYKPQQLPPIENAKGRAFFLFHSPQDRIPIRMAEEAQKDLESAGASVKLKTYEAPHGWPPDVFQQILEGMQWLESQPAARVREEPAKSDKSAKSAKAGKAEKTGTSDGSKKTEKPE